MKKENAIAQAQIEADNNNVRICVVHAPLEMAEDESGPYGYCPELGLHILFPNATVETWVYPNGSNLPNDPNKLRAIGR